MSKQYQDKETGFSVCLELPKVQFEPIITNGKSIQERFKQALQVRKFTLSEDWVIELDNCPFNTELTGTIVIPHKDNKGRPIIFDGLSIPYRWFTYTTTLGLIRPLGVILTASIVHDYAFKYACLEKKEEDSNELTTLALSRDHADELFRMMAKIINNAPILSRYIWIWLKIGKWTGVTYGTEKLEPAK